MKKNNYNQGFSLIPIFVIVGILIAGGAYLFYAPEPTNNEINTNMNLDEYVKSEFDKSRKYPILLKYEGECDFSDVDYIVRDTGQTYSVDDIQYALCNSKSAVFTSIEDRYNAFSDMYKNVYEIKQDGNNVLVVESRMIQNGILIVNQWKFLERTRSIISLISLEIPNQSNYLLDKDINTLISEYPGKNNFVDEYVYKFK